MKYRSRIHILLFFLILVGCAKPRYESGSAPNRVSASKTCEGLDALCPLAFQNLNACAGIHYERTPSVGKEALGVIYFSKSIPSDVTIQARLWMPAHQHFSARPQFQRLDDSRFAIRRMRFFMIGRWELKIQMMKDTQVIDEAILPICL